MGEVEWSFIAFCHKEILECAVFMGGQMFIIFSYHYGILIEVFCCVSEYALTKRNA